MSKTQVKVPSIRHAEKPAAPAMDSSGNDPNLSPRGFERAAALAANLPQNFGRPDFLYATQRSTHSNRSAETLTSLAQVLGVAFNDRQNRRRPDPFHWK